MVLYKSVYCYRYPLSVRLSPNDRHTVLLQVCHCGLGGQEILTDCCMVGVQRANVGSATLSAHIVAQQRLVSDHNSLIYSTIYNYGNISNVCISNITL